MLDNRHSKSNTKAMLSKHVESWIKNGPNPDTIMQADAFGKYIAFELDKTPYSKKTNDFNVDIKNDERVTKSQIRQVFSKLKSIEAKGIDAPSQNAAFLMLKPHLAYAAKRHNKTGLDRLKERLDWGIDAVLNGDQANLKQRFKNFCMLFEAILAYHRAHGGS